MVNNLTKALVESLIDAEQDFCRSLGKISAAENNLGCIDGKIIGTGRSDYTINSTEYNLLLNDREISLIDIPGIEGEEGKFKDIIKESLIKSHLIFYVNGSGKKVEKETLEKMREYMHDGTSVYAVFNVHCKPKKERIKGIDKTYQEELAAAYEKQKKEIAKQTEEELKSFLGDNFKGSICVNGLLSFCAKAINKFGGSTIIRDEDKNLRATQSKFLKEYSDNVEMMESDSCIVEAQNIIADKVDRFDEYVFEENIKKLKIRLSDMILEITNLRNKETNKIKRFLREYDSFEQKCESAKHDFIRNIDRIGKNEVAYEFNPLQDALYGKIEELGGKLDEDTVRGVYNSYQNSIIENLKKAINRKIEAAINEYQKAIEEAETRLIDDLQEDQNIFELEMKECNLKFDFSFMKSLKFGFKDFGKSLITIGGYALSGFSLGSIFPGAGNIIGAILGALAGLVREAWRYLTTTKAERINEAKQKCKWAIDEQIDEITANLKEEIDKLGIKSEIDKKHKEIIKSIENQKSSLRQVEQMLNTVLTELNNRYEKI